MNENEKKETALALLEHLAFGVRQKAEAAALGERPDGIDWHAVARITAYADEETGDAMLDVVYFTYADENEKWKAGKAIESWAADVGIKLENFGDVDDGGGFGTVYRANCEGVGKPRVPKPGETFAGVGQALALRVVAVDGDSVTYDLIDRKTGRSVFADGVLQTRPMRAAAGGAGPEHPVHYWVEGETGEVWHLLHPLD